MAKKFAMSEEHKSALAAGRNEGRAIRNYLEALDSHKPKRGRKRTPSSVEKRLAYVEEAMATAEALDRVRLIQEQMDLHAELEGMEHQSNLADLAEEFIKFAASYSERKHVSYAAWRSFGVPADVLKRAGLRRSG